MASALRIGFCVAALLSATPALAEPICVPTKKVETTNYPGASAIPSTNNLLLPTGKSIEADAQKLIFTGRVVDSNCRPIPEAVVEIWQRNPFGKWTLAEGEDRVTPSPIFAGAGRAITDSEGNFVFTTGFPGVATFRVREKKKWVTLPRAPQLNVRIKANGFKEFKTALFFEGDHRNAKDPVVKKLKPATRDAVSIRVGQDVDGVTLIGTKDITLLGDAPYRTY